MNYNIGDRVRVIAYDPEIDGAEGIVVPYGDVASYVNVELPNHHNGMDHIWHFTPDEIALVEAA